MKSRFDLLGGLAVVLCLSSIDAQAWGLATHVYYAESLASLPLTIPILLTAMRRFPMAVLAGACLPDLALFGRRCGTDVFAGNHQWACARNLLNRARSDEEKAAAVGYCSHLFIDVIAHNHFVPSYEQRWTNVPKLTHAVAEWAMDVHLGERPRIWPAEVLHAERLWLIGYIGDSFACPRAAAAKTLRALTTAERLLRAARLPQACYGLARLLDKDCAQRFDEYLAVTDQALPRIDRVLLGAEPGWHPEGAGPERAGHAPPPLKDFAAIFIELDGPV